MDMQKATEVVESLGVIGVNYKGKSVWIESLHEENNEAEVRDLKTGERHMVRVSELEQE